MSYFPHLENECDNVESLGLRFMLKNKMVEDLAGLICCIAMKSLTY